MNRYGEMPMTKIGDTEEVRKCHARALTEQARKYLLAASAIYASLGSEAAEHLRFSIDAIDDGMDHEEAT